MTAVRGKGVAGLGEEDEGIKENKSILFLCNSNEYMETVIKNTILLAITPNKIKRLGIKLTKHIQDRYAFANYKMLIVNEIKHNLNKCLCI